MVTIERTTDWRFLDSIMRHPDVWDFVRDDSEECKKASLETIVNLPGFYFLAAVLDGIRVGSFAFFPCGEDLELHTSMLGNMRGRNFTQAAIMALDWAFAKTTAHCIITQCFESRRDLRVLIPWFGFKRKSESVHPNTVNGITQSLITYSLPRDGWEKRKNHQSNLK